MKLIDKFGRNHNYLRISLTDRCNLNCIYCNPLKENSAKLNKNELLTFDELRTLIRVFLSELEIQKIRFTGGEPFIRKESIKFLKSIGELKAEYNFELALTTNGTLLQDNLNELKSLGLDKLNISLDSLKPFTYRYITGSEKLGKIIEAINAVEALNFTDLKINTVILKGINDDEIIDFVNFIKNRRIILRFIEYMPFGNNNWKREKFVSTNEIKEKIESCFNLIKLNENPSSPAETYQLSNFTGKVGFISPISNHFCQNCNRIRIKSDGRLKLCLFNESTSEVDLRKYLRNEKTTYREIAEIILNSLQYKEKEHAPVEELMKFGSNNMLNTGG